MKDINTMCLSVRCPQLNQKVMKKLILILLFTITSVSFAQNDSLQKERYEVINAIYKDVDTEKYGLIELDRNFFPFLGLGLIISDYELVESLLGHCADFEEEVEYSYSEILNREELTEIQKQIGMFGYFSRIDPKLISKKIKVTEDTNNSKTAITQPLIYNNKAIVYRTNKNNEEKLFVLVKENGNWKVRCVKHIYLRFDD